MAAITLFGHPQSPIGMGEQLASFSSAMDSIYIEHSIHDIFGGLANTNDVTRPWLLSKTMRTSGLESVRIFHINGDEISHCLQRLDEDGVVFNNESRNIIVPAWELPIYPEVWRNDINRFDEVWAISRYVESMFTNDWCKAHVRYVGQSAERRNGLLYPRKYFGIRGSALVFLAFFDQSSFFSRKNPEAALEMYRTLREKHPYSDFQFVLKAKNINKEADFQITQTDPGLILINKNLDYDQTTSLIDACDVFVSLHRAEGFGRGAAEAILRKKFAITTNYSGVVDYSNDTAVRKVDYRLIRIDEGGYPHCKNQVWAEPSVDHAIEMASEMIVSFENGVTPRSDYISNPEHGFVAQNVCSDFSVGINIINNLDALHV